MVEVRRLGQVMPLCICPHCRVVTIIQFSVDKEANAQVSQLPLKMDFEQELGNFSSLDFHPSHFKCLSDCLENHEHCKKTADLKTSLPRRLVDLGEHLPNIHIFEPKLCVTHYIKQHPVHYVALSHSWSTLSESEKLSMVTTTENQEERCTRIDLRGIPSNYKAVMIMCRSFGFQYLWVDSLCIVQVKFIIICLSL